MTSMLLQWFSFVVINIFCCSGRCSVQIPFFQFNKIDNIFCIWKLADFKCKSWLDSSLSTSDFKLAIMEIRARISSVALITKVSSIFWHIQHTDFRCDSSFNLELVFSIHISKSFPQSNQWWDSKQCFNFVYFFSLCTYTTTNSLETYHHLWEIVKNWWLLMLLKMSLLEAYLHG